MAGAARKDTIPIKCDSKLPSPHEASKLQTLLSFERDRPGEDLRKVGFD